MPHTTPRVLRDDGHPRAHDDTLHRARIVASPLVRETETHDDDDDDEETDGDDAR